MEQQRRSVATPVAQPIHDLRCPLLTNTFLHDGLCWHLAGNRVFLVIFGMRVNALIGNALTAAVYPILGIGASLVFVMSQAGGGTSYALGASGAVMGLAGPRVPPTASPFWSRPTRDRPDSGLTPGYGFFRCR